MAKTSLSILKNWFRNGLKPTQEHFWNWLDSFWHKDEKIPTEAVEGLDEILEDVPSAEQLQNHFTDPAAHQGLFDTKVDKQEGYGLSQANFTPEEKDKLDALEDHSEEILGLQQEFGKVQYLEEKNQPEGYVGLGEDRKIDPEVLPSNLLTQPSTLEEVLARNNTADNEVIVNKVTARFSPANPAKMVGELRNTGMAVVYDGNDVFQIGRLSGNNQTVDFFLHDTENGMQTIMQLRPKIQGSATTFYGPVSGSPATSPGHFVTFSQVPRSEAGTFEPNFKVINGEVEGIMGDYAYQRIGNVVTVFLNFNMENATSTNETGTFEFNLPVPSNAVYAGSGKVGTAPGIYPVASGSVGRFWAGTETALHFEQVKGSGGTIIISIAYMTNQ